MAGTKKAPTRGRRSVKLPINNEWRDKFRASSMKVGFTLNLTRPMLEFLCATADGVLWDRSLYRDAALAAPDNFLASFNALAKRGLVERNLAAHDSDAPFGHTTIYVLTPAGKAVVELVKLAGMFVEADAAIEKKARRA